MKRIQFLSVLAFFTIFTLTGFSQAIQRNELVLPKEVAGYQVLKCDLHMHTIFSDGVVWPTVRVSEAFSEGLDAIAITDHLEYRPRFKEMNVSDTISRNSAYKLAVKGAENAGLLLIPACEVTKEVPPGHFNALFIKDADQFTQYIDKTDPGKASTIYAALKEAKRQNAFIVWNHPWYKVKTNESIWFPIIDSLYNLNYFQGIEVINTNRYDPLVFKWTREKKLTIMSNTDSHSPISLEKDKYRTMTIVFAKERTIESIHEALIARRSVAYSNNFLYGDSLLLAGIFQKSVTIQPKTGYSKTAYLVLSNTSSISYEITLKDTKGLSFGSSNKKLILPQKGEVAVLVTNTKDFKKGDKITATIQIENLQSGPNVALTTEIGVTL